MTFDVAIVGLGTMGSAAAYHLARRGASVIGFDRFDVPNTMASHHGHSRMIRLSYYEHPDYVPLLRRAYEGWDELSRLSGQTMLYRTGGLYVGEPTDDFVAGSLRSAQEHGLPHEYLSRGEIAERFPQFELPSHWAGLYEPEAGPVLPERAVAACASLARKFDAELHEREPVTDVQAECDTIALHTERGVYRARHVVFTQGAWTRDIGVPLTVTRQVLGWVEPANPQRLTADVFPAFAINKPDQSAYYGFPLIDDIEPRGLFKIAHHWHDQPTDPATIDRDPQPGDEADFRPALRFLPDANGPTARVSICMYTNTPDSHFIIDAHPRFPPGRATLACGFSGHGFKFAPVIGQAIADLATHGKTDLPIDFLSLRRFA